MRIGNKEAGSIDEPLFYFDYEAGEGDHFFDLIGTVEAPAGAEYFVSKLGVRMGAQNPGPSLRLGLYAGATLVGATLIAEAEYTGSATEAYIEVELASSQSIPDNTNLWIVVKSTGTTYNDRTSAPSVMIATSGGGGDLAYYGPSTAAAGNTEFSSPWTQSTYPLYGGAAKLCAWAELAFAGSEITADIEGAGAVSAELDTGLEATVEGAGAVSAELDTGLEAAVEGAGAVSAELDTGLEAAVEGAGAIEAELETGINVAAAIEGVGTFAGEMQVITPFLPAVRRYKAVLAADGFDDYEIPVSSIELRLRASPKQCYINVTIPAALTHEEAISDRIDGTVTLYELLDDAETEILTGNIDAFRLYEGLRSASAQITAYKQVTWSDTKVREIPYATYRAIDGTTIRYRFNPILIYPGDTARVNGNNITVAEVYWSINPGRQTMEIKN